MSDAPTAAAPAPASESAIADGSAVKARRRSWIVFAAGLEGFNVPIGYVVFAPYFVDRVASDPVAGQQQLTLALTISGLIAALLAPPVALASEHPGRRRALMTWFVAINAAAAVALWLAAPGSPAAILLIVLFAYGLAAAANDLAYALYGSMLPDVAAPTIIGRTSGLATGVSWGVGIALTLVYVFTFIVPATPPLGLDAAAGEPPRLTGPLAAVLMIVFCAPLLLMSAGPAPPRDTRTLRVWLKEEFAALLAERAAAIAVAARLVYWSGVVLVMVLGPVVARSIMQWPDAGSSLFGLTVLATGAVGAAFGGVLDDRLGTRNALSLMLVALAVSLGLILTNSPDRVLGFISVDPRAPDARIFTSTAEWVVLGLGALTGLFLGTTGPMGRALIARYSPPGRTARYYGLAALAGNATNVTGPLFALIATALTGSQRVGLLVAPVFLALGVLVLMRLPKHGYRTIDVKG